MSVIGYCSSTHAFDTEIKAAGLWRLHDLYIVGDVVVAAWNGETAGDLEPLAKVSTVERVCPQCFRPSSDVGTLTHTATSALAGCPHCFSCPQCGAPMRLVQATAGVSLTCRLCWFQAAPLPSAAEEFNTWSRLARLDSCIHVALATRDALCSRNALSRPCDVTVHPRPPTGASAGLNGNAPSAKSLLERGADLWTASLQAATTRLPTTSAQAWCSQAGVPVDATFPSNPSDLTAAVPTPVFRRPAFITRCSVDLPPATHDGPADPTEAAAILSQPPAWAAVVERPVREVFRRHTSALGTYNASKFLPRLSVVNAPNAARGQLIVQLRNAANIEARVSRIVVTHSWHCVARVTFRGAVLAQNPTREDGGVLLAPASNANAFASSVVRENRFATGGVNLEATLFGPDAPGMDPTSGLASSSIIFGIVWVPLDSLVPSEAVVACGIDVVISSHTISYVAVVRLPGDSAS